MIETSSNSYVKAILIRRKRKDPFWVPENLATLGKWLRIKNDKEWVDGYQVSEVFSIPKYSRSQLVQKGVPLNNVGPSVRNRILSGEVNGE